MSKRNIDRESGTYSGLMLSLRKYRDRLEIKHGVKLSGKPREMDCLIIDKKYPGDVMDNAIAKFFSLHNIIELKSFSETLNIASIWKVISYGAQYISEQDFKADDVTLTLIRVSKPVKAMRLLREQGYGMDNPLPGVYYISGMSAMRLQIIVSSELAGEEYAPLRIQRKNAREEDIRKFIYDIRDKYTGEENGFAYTILKNGMYDDIERVIEYAEEDEDMKKNIMDLFQEDINKTIDENKDKWFADGEAKGRADGEAERKRLENIISELQAQLKKTKTAIL